MPSYESTTTRLLHQDMKVCALVEDLLPLYMEGEVSPTSRDLMVEHLAHCEHCAGFLAGVQSARVYLRREQAARTAVVAQDRPAQQAVSRVQTVTRGVAAGVALLIGMGMTAGVWSSMHEDGMFVSIIIALVSFAVLGLRYRRREGLTQMRWLTLGAGCLAGSIGFVSLFAALGEETAFVGMLLFAASISAVGYLLSRSADAPASAAAQR